MNAGLKRRPMLRKSILVTGAACALAMDATVAAQQLSVKATHGSDGYKAANVIDGDETTFWAGDGHDLTELPANLIISFAEPRRVGRIEVLTQILKERLRLKHLEVYAKTDGGWTELANVTDNQATRLVLEVPTVKSDTFRVRVRDTHRPDHAFPRINEIRFLEPQDLAAAPHAPSPSAIPDELRTERLFIQMATGDLPVQKTAPYNPDKGYLWYVKTFLDTMIEEGRDRYGPEHSPMFVSILTLSDHRHPEISLPPIEGQRQHDRANFGGNLQHDVPLLLAAEHLSRMTGEPRYADSASQYLDFFLDHCTRTETGLWPWGEHAHWDMFREKAGHDTHEFLGRVPLEFWEQAWNLNPDAVRRQADGVLHHVVNLRTFDFNRHASLSQPRQADRQITTGFLDFPRHGAFYLQLWAFVYSKTGDERYATYCSRMMDKQAADRHPKTGLLPSTTTRKNASHGSQTQLSMAVTMLEALPLLKGRPEAERCKTLALSYLDTLTALPHRTEHGQFVVGAPLAGFSEASPPRYHQPGFAAHYGGGSYLGTMAGLWAQAYRLTERQDCLDLALAMATYYAENDLPLSPEIHTRAKVFGGLVNLMLDMHDIDGDPRWLQAAETYARKGIEQLYQDGLFRGATGLWYYESELWVSTFCYSLVRLHAALDSDIPDLPPLVFHR